ncbi:MAG: NAD(+)/NADH kinase [Microthrixaceae bacterium]|nr:NAD(+)/NADH kinase [Microthrixaceae bacterium]
MATFGLVVHPGKGIELGRSVIDWLRKRDHEIHLGSQEAALLGYPDLAVDDDKVTAGLDLLLSLGGDGTMLRSVELAARDDVPVMGVNLGQLGYLTQVEPSGVTVALKRFLAGSYTIEDRHRVRAVVKRAGKRSKTYDALNEVVIEKSMVGRTVRLDIELDGRPFTSYVCDGLILATATGSTAYAFSVRGPIIDPRHRAILMTPVAAHMLFDRSIVLQPDCEVTVTVASDRDAAVLVDGQQGETLVPGDRVVCTMSPQPARLVTLGGSDFHSVLRSKFGLSTR